MTEPTVYRIEVAELTLRGVRRGQRDTVVEAFHGELTRLLTEQGPPEPAPATREVLTGERPMPATHDPRRIGRALARSVHAALVAGAEAGDAGSTARPGRSEP